MADENTCSRELELKKLKLSYASDNRKSEISLLWSRSLYFWGFITVVLVSFGGAFQSKLYYLAVIAAVFGYTCSLAWSLANRSSKYWQEFWEHKVDDAEKELYGSIFSTADPKQQIDERWFWGAKHYSPSKLATMVSDPSTVTWILLLFAAIFSNSTCYPVLIGFIAAISGLILTVILLFMARSGAQHTPVQFYKKVISYIKRLRHGTLRT